MTQKSVATLRERKKLQVKRQLKEHALRLFVEQGFVATTIEQIAESANVSSRTFFRYFPNKEEVLFDDEYDARLIASFRAQPPQLSVVGALRNALRDAFGKATAVQQDYELRRHTVISTTPELQIRNEHELVRNIELLDTLIAARTGQKAGSLYVRTLASALVGVLIGAQTMSPGAGSSQLAHMDMALTQFEKLIKKD